MSLFHKLKTILNTGKSLKKKVLVGSFWLFLLEIFSTGLITIQTIILARLLAPEHFGIIGIFFIISAALESFSRTGFEKALIQRKEINNEHLNTAWSVAVIRGAILFLLLFSSSPLIAKFFNAPKTLPVIRIMGLSFILQGFQNIGIIYFSRDLVFRKKFIWKSSGLLANFLVSIPLAFILRNEWAIVWGLLASAATLLVFSYVLHPYRAKLSFNAEIFGTLFNYGKWLLLSYVVVFFTKQLDKIMVTKLLGMAELGIYLMAFRFAKLPELLSNPIPNALFPAYSKFQENFAVLKEKYLYTLRVINLFTIPIVGGMIVLAKPFIAIFLGDKWLGAILPMQILTLATGINIITYTGLSLFAAVGKTDFLFKVHVVNLLVLSVLIYPLITYFKIGGASLCYLMLAIASFIVWKREVGKQFEIKIKDLFYLAFPILSTLFFVIILYYFSITGIGSFLGAICLGAIIYFSIGLIVHKFTRFKVLTELFEVKSYLKSEG